MSRIRELARTPLVTIERYDHAPGDVPDDRREEEAAGFAINVVEQGSFRLISGGRAWNVAPGATFCSAPGFVYRCEHADEPPDDACLTVSFGEGTCDDAFTPARWPARTGRPIAPADNRSAYAAQRLKAKLEESALDVEAGAFELLAATIDKRSAKGSVYRQSQLAWYSRRVDRAREKLDAEYADDHSLGALARDAGMSPFHFARVFAELVGTPPHRYLVRKRLDVATTLLLQGASVSDACFSSGFSSLSHFVRSFRRRHGVPPSSVRARATATAIGDGERHFVKRPGVQDSELRAPNSTFTDDFGASFGGSTGGPGADGGWAGREAVFRSELRLREQASSARVIAPFRWRRFR